MRGSARGSALIKQLLGPSEEPSRVLRSNNAKILGALTHENPSPLPLSPKGRGVFLLTMRSVHTLALPQGKQFGDGMKRIRFYTAGTTSKARLMRVPLERNGSVR